MNLNMQTVRSYLGQAAQTAKELSSQAAVAAKDLSSQVVGAKCLREYTVQGLTGSAGPGSMWKIFAARSRKEGTSNPLASVWILDKRAVTEASRGSARVAEAFLQLCRKDAANLAKLKHPNVVRLLEPFEETRSQLLMVTEAVTASVADVLQLRKASSAGSSGAGSLQLSELEIKHGFLQVADGLHFLHTQANQIHRGISPEAICITAAGAWKLAGFGFAMLADFGNTNPAEAAFDYGDSSASLAAQSLKPALSYTAPELVKGAQQSSGGLFSAADVFSLGLVMYEVIGEKQLLNVGQSAYDYYSKIASFHQLDMSAVPYELQSLLGPMLSVAPSARPSAISITGSQYFQGDVMLRALRFMDSMIQRDTMQKAAFLNDLTTFWHKFDDRVLRLKVLPHLLEEVRSEQLQQLVLPLVIHMLGKQDKQDFADTSAPALMPIFQAAKGETLLLLVHSTPTLLQSMPRPYVTSMMVPLLVRVADQGDPRCQDEVLKQLPQVAEQTEYTTLKAELLPRMHALCLKTTSASVRVNALTCMARVAARLDEEEAAKMLQTASKVSAVDHTAPTVMCVLGLGDAIARQYGLAMAAQQVLPLLCPLLVQPTLSGPQFSQAMTMVKQILGQIESKRVGQMEVPERAAIGGANMSKPSSNPGTPKGGLPSWDTPTVPPQAPQLRPSAPQPPPTQNTTQSSWQDPTPMAAPSWQRPSGSSMMASSGSSDPFAGLPPPQAAPSYQAGGNDMLSDSLFSSLSTDLQHRSGLNDSLPQNVQVDGHVTSGTGSTSNPRSKPQLPHPGDQLANVMSNPNMDNLFLDPTWRDPDVSMVGVPSQGVGAFKPPPSMARLSSNVQGSGAEDPFSQLSLSRDTSGSATSSGRPSKVNKEGQPGSSQGGLWQQQTAAKMIAPISVGSMTPSASKHTDYARTVGSTSINRLGLSSKSETVSHRDSLI